MRQRTLDLVRSTVAVVITTALFLAGSASPASAATFGESPLFQAVTAGLSQTSATLAAQCKFDVLVAIELRQQSEAARVENRLQTDGVSSHEVVSSWLGDGSGQFEIVNDAEQSLITGEAFYSKGKYTSNLSSGALKGIDIGSLLYMLGGNNESFFQSASAPAGLGSLKPGDVCADIRDQFAQMSAAIRALEKLPVENAVFTQEPNPLFPGNTSYLIDQSSMNGSAQIRLERDATGAAVFISSNIVTVDTEIRTAIHFMALGDAVVVPVPAGRVFTIAEMNIATVRFYLDPKVRSYAVSVQRVVERAAKFAKGAAKNKVTATMIQVKAKPLVPAKSGMKLQKISGGVKISGSKSGVTSSFCLRASGAKALLTSC